MTLTHCGAEHLVIAGDNRVKQKWAAGGQRLGYKALQCSPGHASQPGLCLFQKDTGLLSDAEPTENQKWVLSSLLLRWVAALRDFTAAAVMKILAAVGICVVFLFKSSQNRMRVYYAWTQPGFLI